MPQAIADKTSSPNPSQKDGRTKTFAPVINAGLSCSSIKSVNIILCSSFKSLTFFEILSYIQPFLPAMTSCGKSLKASLLFNNEYASIRPSTFLEGFRVLTNKM